MKTFVMQADIEFAAEGIEDAFEQLELHFRNLRLGFETSLIDRGTISIGPKTNQGED